MDENYKKLNDEIARRLDNMIFIDDIDTDKESVEALSKLYELRIKEKNSVNEDDERYARRNMDKEKMKYDQDVREENKIFERLFDGIEVGAKIVIPLISFGIYCHWMKKGFIFEEEGTITSSTFKNHNRQFKLIK